MHDICDTPQRLWCVSFVATRKFSIDDNRSIAERLHWICLKCGLTGQGSSATTMIRHMYSFHNNDSVHGIKNYASFVPEK